MIGSRKIYTKDKTSPVLTSATGGMSGCHRLWRGSFCSHGLFLTSIGTTSLGPYGAMADGSVQIFSLVLKAMKVGYLKIERFFEESKSLLSFQFDMKV